MTVSWWGRQSLEIGRTVFWQIGPLNLWVQHLQQQWRIGHCYKGDWLEANICSLPSNDSEEPDPEAQFLECITGPSSGHELTFVPTLSDRPMVTRLSTPLMILPKESTRIFVVSPLWIRLEANQTKKELIEIPIFRLSDSWFGPMNNSGELCYSSSGPAFLDIREVPLRLHCAITAVSISNSLETPLLLQRVKVPLQRLSLFYSTRTGFWTDGVRFESSEKSDMAALRIDRQPPPEAAPTQYVGPPRTGAAEPPSVVRAFSALFRERSPS